MAAQQNPPRGSWPDWSSGLPDELLEYIGKRLASGHDAASFRSVCSPWRAAVPFKSFAPLLLLPFGPDSESVTFYSVSEEKAFSLPLPEVRGKMPCGSSRGWLALMDEAASVTLLNPFTGARVALPPADERVAAASTSRRVSKVDARWVMHPPDNGFGHAAAAAPVAIKLHEMRDVFLHEMRDVFLHEIVLSAPPVAGRECVAMAVVPSSTEVAFCRVGVDSAWTLLDTNLECSADSIVHCQGRFVAIDCDGEISICGSFGAGATPVATPAPSSLATPTGVCHRSYLEANGELHLVGAVLSLFHRTRRFAYRSVVYRCNLLERRPAWSEVKDVGHLTLFVSKHFKDSFSGIRASKYGRNNIYFSEPLYGDPNEWEHRLEIADIATGTSEVQAFCQKMQHSETLCWIRPNIWNGGGLSKCNDEESQKGAALQPEPAGEVKADMIEFNNNINI